MPRPPAGPSRRRAAPAPGPGGARFGGRALLALTALALVAVPFGLLLFLVASRWAPLLRLDDGTRDALHGYAAGSPGFVRAMTVLSGLGSTAAWVVIVAVLAGWLLWLRRPRTAVFVVVTVAGSALLNVAVKEAVRRARPVVADPVASAHGLSFPSGHAQAALVGWGVLVLVLLPVLSPVWRRLLVGVAVLMVLGIGFSRIALSLHFVSDVLGGFVLGAAWLAALTAAFGTWLAERGTGPPAQPTGNASSRSRAPAAWRSGDAPTRPDTAADNE